MRLVSCFLLLSLLSTTATSTSIQSPLSNANSHIRPGVSNTKPPTSIFAQKHLSHTLIDALSNDTDYSTLLRLIQRAKLVPTLNKLVSATLFAPTNDAIARYRDQNPDGVWAIMMAIDDGVEVENVFEEREEDGWVMLTSAMPSTTGRAVDNVKEQLRQHLFYHLLNYTLPNPPIEFPEGHPAILKTLHYPVGPEDPPTEDPPPSPPWLPTPGGLLGGEPQRLRIATREGSAYVGVDFLGAGGAQVVKDSVVVSNGMVVGIGDVLDLPGDLLYEIERQPSLKTFAEMLTSETKEILKSTPKLTVFMPEEGAWKDMDELEMRYLRSGFAEKDVEKLVGMHASGTGPDKQGIVGWSEYWGEGREFDTFFGNTLHLSFNSDGTVVLDDNSTVLSRDIYASNGVLHVVSDLLTPPGSFQLNAEKYLLALNATSFVALLRSVNLSHYVDDEHDDKPWTILAPRDDVFSTIPVAWLPSLPVPISLNDSIEIKPPPSKPSEVERIMKYHILPGAWRPEDLQDGHLLGTELREAGLGGGRQKLPVSVNSKDKKLEPGSSGNGEVGFGGGMVIGEPVEVQGSIIYLLSKLLEPPPDAIEAILPSSTLSTFLTSVFASSLDDTLRFSRSSTILVPQNDAFQELGLLTTHLLLPEARRDLVKVVKHHILTSVLYESDLGNGTTGTHGTLEGSDVRLTDGFITSSGEWEVFGRINPANVLTKTGVVHEMDRVLIPRSVKVDVADLTRAAKGLTMAGLVTRSGFGGVLNGTLSIDDIAEWKGWRSEKRHKKGLDAKGAPTGWILLCPTDDAFKKVNLTRLLADLDETKRFVMQHIVPAPLDLPSTLEERQRDPWASYPIPFEDDASYNSLLAPDDSQHSDITFRYPDNRADKTVYVGIKNIRGSLGSTEFAKILSYGRTTTHGPRGGVIMIDRVLDPYVSGWWGAWGAAAATGAGGVSIIVALWFWWHYWWHSWTEEATYEPLDTGEDS